MAIEDGPEQRQPIGMESLMTTGAVGPIPPRASELGDLGPVGDGSLTLSQRQLDEMAASEGSSVAVSPFRASLRRLRRDKRAMASLGIVIFALIFSYIGPLVYTHIGPTLTGGGILGNQTVTPAIYHSYTNQDLFNTDAYSSLLHPMGTDALGRDIMARLMAGVSVSIEVAAMVECFDIGLGVIVGVLAGFYGGWIDTVLARFTDVMFAFPGLLFAILAAATLGPAFQDRFGLPGRLILVSLALGIAIWPQMARYVRGQTLQLKETQFIEAARLAGTSDLKIMARHIVPNLADIVIVAATLDIVGTIIGEAVISLLGLGVQPPGSSLGLMISDAVAQIPLNPWEVIWPSLALAILVLAFSFFGDGIRDAFDPRGQA